MPRRTSRRLARLVVALGALPLGAAPQEAREWRVVRAMAAGAAEAAATSPRNDILVTAGAVDELLLHDIHAGRVPIKLSRRSDELPDTRGLRTVAVHPLGGLLASAGEDRQIRLWDLAARAEIGVLTGHTDAVACLAFDPVGDVLASGGEDRSILLWDTARLRLERALTGHGSGVRAVSFAPDGRTLASAGDDWKVKLWDVASGNERATLTGHTGWVEALAFSADGALLASSGDDGSIRVWDPVLGRSVRTIASPGGGVRSLAFAPTGRRLAAAGADGVARIWDADTGALCDTVPGHGDRVTFVAWLSAERLVTLSGGVLRIWSPAAPLLTPALPEEATLRPGLAVRGYSGWTFSTLQLERVDEAVDFDWREGAAWSGGPSTLFSMRWKGILRAPESGRYEMVLRGEDGFILLIDEAPVLDRWFKGIKEARVDIPLSKGLHSVELQFHKTRKTASLRWLWRRPGGPLETVRAPFLLHDPGGWVGPPAAPLNLDDGSVHLEAEDYAAGGDAQPGVDFADTTPGNVWKEHRPHDVDIAPLPGGGRAVSAVRQGEWIRYVFGGEGAYRLALRCTTWGALGADVRYEAQSAAGERQEGRVRIPPRGSANAWTEHEGPVIRCTPGSHVLRVIAEVDHANLDSIRLRRLLPRPPAAPPSPAPGGTPRAFVRRALLDADPERRFALLEAARNAAAETVDAVCFIAACEIMGRLYDVDAPALKLETASRAAARATTVADLDRMLVACLRISEAAIAEDRADVARAALDLAASPALKNANDRVARLEGTRRRVDRLRGQAPWREWVIQSGGFDGCPSFLDDHAGREHVLRTHPQNARSPAVLERTVDVAAGRRATLALGVCAQAGSDWNLRVLANGNVIEARPIEGTEWRDIEVDLTPFVIDGKVRVRVENAASGWKGEFAYWSTASVRVHEKDP